MPSLHLISHHLCPYVQRAAIVLTEKGAPFERTDIDLAAKPDWFLKISPLGRTPVLLVDGEPLFESQVIAEFVDEITPGSLHPAEPLLKARHRSWIEFGSETLAAIAKFYAVKDEEAFGAAKAALRAKLERIESEIEGPFFAGERFHMIDGVWAAVLRYLPVLESMGPFGLTEALPRLTVWAETLRERPSMKAVVAPDYAARLDRFVQARDSYLGAVARARAAMQE